MSQPDRQHIQSQYIEGFARLNAFKPQSRRRESVAVRCRIRERIVENFPNALLHALFAVQRNREGSVGLKRGGVLTVVRAEVELNVTASDIPDHIEVDISGADIGDVLHISDVTLPKGSKTVIDRDFVIANISAPSSLRSAGEDEDDDAEIVTEVIGEEKADGEDES